MEYKDILDDMLRRTPEEYDSSVGSFFYDIMFPLAERLLDLHNRIDDLQVNVFALTAVGEYLDRKAAEQGLTRRPGTYAKGTVTITGKKGEVVLKGSKVAAANVLFAIDETVTIPEKGTIDVGATCVISGTDGNVKAGAINRFPVALPGLIAVTNAADFTGGYAGESDEDLRERYLEKVSRPNASGNVYHYISWAKEVVGVGNVRVIPLANGPGTVTVIITDSDNKPADEELVARVKEHIEQERPIGANVTVKSAESLAINITVSITSDVKELVTDAIKDAIADYLSDVALTKTYVSIAKLGALILSVSGVDDYDSETFTVNGGKDNIELADGVIPVLGSVTIT